MGYIDAHVHVWTDDTAHYSLAPGYKPADMKPKRFTPEDLFRHCKPGGVDRVNLIQMSFYGFDNSFMLDMIALDKGTFAGTAVIAPEQRAPAALMDELAKKGVRAFRIPPALSKKPVTRGLESAGYAAMFAAGARNRQAMSCLIAPDALPEL